MKEASALEQILYTDRQFLGSPIIWAVIILAAGLAWWDFYRYLRSGSSKGRASLLHRPVQTLMAAGVIAPLFFVSMHLSTVVTPDRISVRFFPLQLAYREIALEEVVDCQVEEYQPLTHGGWGIRGTASNRVYILSGRNGVRLMLRDGRSILLGTAHPEQLAEAVNSAREAQNSPR